MSMTLRCLLFSGWKIETGIRENIEMWLFLVIVLTTGIINMSIRFSLYDNWRNCVLAIVTVVVVLGAVYPFAVRLNIQDVTTFMNNYNSLVNLCIVVIVEAISLLLCVSQLLITHFHHRSVTWSKTIVLFPSVTGMFGMFIGLVYILNCISGWQLGLLAFVSLVAVLVALLFFQLLFRLIASSWYFRLDFVLVLAFIQIIVAMFLPLVVSGIGAITTNVHNLGRDFLTSILAFALISICSYLIRFSINKYIGVSRK